MGENVGREQSGVRPVYIVADESRIGYGMVIGIPSTSQVEGKTNWPYVVSVPANIVGSKRSLFLVHQIRALSTTRLQRRLSEGDEGLTKELSERLSEMLDLP